MPMSQPVALTVAPVMGAPLAIMAAVSPVDPAAVQTAAPAGLAPPTAADGERCARQCSGAGDASGYMSGGHAYRWLDMGYLL